MSDKFAWEKMARARAAKRGMDKDVPWKYLEQQDRKKKKKALKQKNRRIQERLARKAKKASHARCDAWDVTTRLWFGKHKGERLCDIPTDYLQWMIREIQDLSPRLRKSIQVAIDSALQRAVVANLAALKEEEHARRVAKMHASVEVIGPNYVAGVEGDPF